MDKNILIEALRSADDQRDRSKQVAIGVSQLGGCRRQVWHKLNGDAETNPTLRLASIMGTAIHATIEAAQPSNIIVLCAFANGLAESDANFARVCRDRGWKLHSWQNPATTPVFDVIDGVWYALDNKFGRIVLPS